MGKVGKVGKSCQQTFETTKEKLLQPETTEEIATSCKDGAITEIEDSLINNLSGEKTLGFSREALYINGYSPLNELANEISEKLSKDVTTIAELSQSILGEGNTHTVAEVNEFHDAVKEKYEGDVNKLQTAVDKYNHEVDKHNEAEEKKAKEEEDKGNNYSQNRWGKIRIESAHEAVDDIQKKQLDRAPNPSAISSTEVKNAEKTVKDSWDNYVKEYEKVVEWKDLDTSGVSTTVAAEGENSTETTSAFSTDENGRLNLNIDEELKKLDDKRLDGTTYTLSDGRTGTYDDQNHTITVENDDGSMTVYHYYRANGLFSKAVTLDYVEIIPPTNSGSKSQKYNPDGWPVEKYNDGTSVVTYKHNGTTEYLRYDKKGTLVQERVISKDGAEKTFIHYNGKNYEYDENDYEIYNPLYKHKKYTIETEDGELVYDEFHGTVSPKKKK